MLSVVRWEGSVKQYVRDRFGRLPLLVADEVSVDVLGDRDGGVSEHLGYDPQWGSLSEHDRGCGVAKLMGRPVPEVGAGTKSVEVVGEVVGVDGCAFLGCEHKVPFRPFRSGGQPLSSLPCAVRPEKPIERRREVEDSPRLPRLQVS